MANVTENLFTILFADDTTVLIEGIHINTMIATLNCELAKLTEWLNANKLSIKVSKSHNMVFHWSRWKINKGNILLDTTILSQVTFTKFLGVILDDKLKWTHHISYIKNKISIWYGYGYEKMMEPSTWQCGVCVRRWREQTNTHL